jgi:hypothetical protein
MKQGRRALIVIPEELLKVQRDIFTAQEMGATVCLA